MQDIAAKVKMNEGTIVRVSKAECKMSDVDDALKASCDEFAAEFMLQMED